MHGIGRSFDNKSGHLFEGQFERGVHHGFGRMIFGPNGEGKKMYVGMWEYGLLHGMGDLIFRNGQVQSGEFEENEFQDFEFEFSDEEIDDFYATKDKMFEKTYGDRAFDSQALKYNKRCVFFDQHKALYIPYICTDMFYYLQKVRLWRYIIYKIDDETSNSVMIEQKGLRQETFEDMVAAIPEKSPRWIIFDLEYEDNR